MSYTDYTAQSRLTYTGICSDLCRLVIVYINDDDKVNKSLKIRDHNVLYIR